MAFLLHGGTVITMNAARSVGMADILVEGDRIIALGPQASLLAEAAQAEKVDVSGKIIIPGLIQGHMHATQALFRGLADDLALMEWLRERTWPLEGAHDDASNAASARLAAAELIAGGTTALVDMGAAHHEDALIQVMLEVGLRGLFGKCMMDGGEGVPASMQEDTAASLKETERLINTWHMRGNGRIRYAVAPRFAPTSSRQLLEGARDLARQNGLRLHTHASENLAEILVVEQLHGMRNVKYLHTLGYTGADVLLAHCIWLDEEEMHLLADTGTHVIHCPSSNTKMSSGIAPVVELKAMGVSIGLGLDGAHNHMDGLVEVRMASILQKARLNDPLALPAMEALELATLGGAAAMGQEQDLGSLEPGKKADLVVLDMHMLHTAPGIGRNPVQWVVYEATRQNVLHTMVDGMFLYRDRHFTTLNLEQVMQEAEEQCAKVMKRSNLFPSQE